MLKHASVLPCVTPRGRIGLLQAFAEYPLPKCAGKCCGSCFKTSSSPPATSGKSRSAQHHLLGLLDLLSLCLARARAVESLLAVVHA